MQLYKELFWCKGYAAHYGSITNVIDGGTVESILKLKNDMGLIDHQNNFVVDIEMMGALLSMKQFRLLAMYGGKRQYVKFSKKLIVVIVNILELFLLMVFMVAK